MEDRGVAVHESHEIHGEQLVEVLVHECHESRTQKIL